MNRMIEDMKRRLGLFDHSPKPSLLRRIERIAWCDFTWRLQITMIYRIRAWRRRKRRTRTPSFYRTQVRDLLHDDAKVLGRVLTKDMRALVAQLRFRSVDSQTIRDGVIGRVVRRKWRRREERSSGRKCEKVATIDLKPWRKRALLWLGWLWHLIATVAIALLILLVVLIPGSLIFKTAVVFALVAFYVFCGGLMNAITLRAVLVWSAFQNYVAEQDGFRSVGLRVVK